MGRLSPIDPEHPRPPSPMHHSSTAHLWDTETGPCASLLVFGSLHLWDRGLHPIPVDGRKPDTDLIESDLECAAFASRLTLLASFLVHPLALDHMLSYFLGGDPIQCVMPDFIAPESEPGGEENDHVRRHAPPPPPTPIVQHFYASRTPPHRTRGKRGDVSNQWPPHSYTVDRW